MENKYDTQSRPESGMGCQVKFLKTFKLFRLRSEAEESKETDNDDTDEVVERATRDGKRWHS